MLGPFKEYWTFSNVQRALIVTKELHRLCMEDSQEAKKVHTLTGSPIPTLIDQYSASAEDLETVACFFVPSEMGEYPQESQNNQSQIFVKEGVLPN